MALSTAEKARWAEIDSIVAEHKAKLKSATTHETLKDFAEEQGFMNENDFGKYKFSLKKIAVSYEDLRAQTFEAQDKERAEALESLAADAPTVMLWTGAVEGDNGEGSFAICNSEGDAIWYGRFFDGDKIRVAGDLISAEQSVAEKAVWIASKAFEAADHKHGRLYLHSTCPALDEHGLRAQGARFGVAVDIEVNEDLRAVAMAEVPGFKKWQDNDLTELVEADTDE